METNNQNPNPLPRNCIYCVLTVARQIEGDWYCFRSEKAFADAQKAEDYASNLNRGFVDPSNPRKRMAIKISTEHGDIPCSCLASVYEMELEQ